MPAPDPHPASTCAERDSARLVKEPGSVGSAAHTAERADDSADQEQPDRTATPDDGRCSQKRNGLGLPAPGLVRRRPHRRTSRLNPISRCAIRIPQFSKRISMKLIIQHLHANKSK
jgi:hypothetical protein